MKFYGDEAIEMMKQGERKEERILIGTDPWWGEKYMTKVTYKINGKIYNAFTDRDGWPVLEEKED